MISDKFIFVQVIAIFGLFLNTPQTAWLFFLTDLAGRTVKNHCQASNRRFKTQHPQTKCVWSIGTLPIDNKKDFCYLCSTYLAINSFHQPAGDLLNSSDESELSSARIQLELKVFQLSLARLGSWDFRASPGFRH